MPRRTAGTVSIKQKSVWAKASWAKWCATIVTSRPGLTVSKHEPWVAITLTAVSGK